MSRSRMSHECLRRDSRVVLPRVGGGVGGRGEVGEACMSSHWQHSRPVDNADPASPTARHDAWALRAEFGGGL